MRPAALMAVMLLAAATTPVSAKGCLKGAVVGGVAGHYAGHHGAIGAAVGCLVGRHRAKKRAQARSSRRSMIARVEPIIKHKRAQSLLSKL